MTAFMKAGIPIAKLVHFRNILEENALRFTDRSHMTELVLLIHDEEISRIKEEINGKFILVIFDGTLRLGEVLAVVLHYVDGWKIVQRQVRLEFLAKSLSEEEVARELIDINWLVSVFIHINFLLLKEMGPA